MTQRKPPNIVRNAFTNKQVPAPDTAKVTTSGNTRLSGRFRALHHPHSERTPLDTFQTKDVRGLLVSSSTCSLLLCNLNLHFFRQIHDNRYEFLPHHDEACGLNSRSQLPTLRSVPPCTVSLTMLSLLWYCPGVYTCLHMGRSPQFLSHLISCLTSKSRSTTTDVSP